MLPSRRLPLQGILGHIAMHQPLGAMSHKRASVPVIGHGITPDDHFTRAIALDNASEIPTFAFPSGCADLRYAASQHILYHRDIKARRRTIRMALKELSDRCVPLTEHLRQFQPPSVCQITSAFHLGLVCILSVLMHWPDLLLPLRLVLGFVTTGTLEETYIFERQPAGEPELTRQRLVHDSESLLEHISTAPVDEEAEFLWQSCLDEQAKGFAGPISTKEEMNIRFGRGKWSPIPTFVIKQANGKKRRIDNGKRGGQNTTAVHTERLRMISPFQPSICARILAQAARQQELTLG